MKSKFTTDYLGSNVVLLLQEELDAEDKDLLQSIQDALKEGNHCHIWIDCKSLDRIRSLGACHFVNQLLLLKRHQAGILLLNPGIQLLNVLSLLKIKHLFAMAPTVDKAYQWLDEKGPKGHAVAC